MAPTAEAPSPSRTLVLAHCGSCNVVEATYQGVKNSSMSWPVTSFGLPGPWSTPSTERRAVTLGGDGQPSCRTWRSVAAKPSGSPVWPYSPPRKPPWPLGKITGTVPSRCAAATAPR